MDKKLKIILTGGGSGGHVIPALALLPELNRTFDEIAFIGGSGIEKTLVAKEGLKYYEISTAGLDRKRVLKNIKLPFILIKSVKECKKILREFKPNVVFGKGGYVSLPAVLAARLLHIPIVCHESDLTLGLANKIAYKCGAIILTSFDRTATLNKDFIYTGFPLRKKLFLGDKQNVILKYNLNTSKKNILILGGSLGASAINDALSSALPQLLSRFNVIHITGKGKKNCGSHDGYVSIEYTSEIQDFYAVADIVVSRAGAGALAEISTLKKAAIFIPLPRNASRGDQLQNAEIAKEHGAIILNQEDLSAENFVNAIYKCGKKMTPVSITGNSKIANFLTAFADNPKT